MTEFERWIIRDAPGAKEPRNPVHVFSEDFAIQIARGIAERLGEPQELVHVSKCGTEVVRTIQPR